MGSIIRFGKGYNVVKYGTDYTVEQLNGVRVSTHGNYTKAYKAWLKLEGHL